MFNSTTFVCVTWREGHFGIWLMWRSQLVLFSKRTISTVSIFFNSSDFQWYINYVLDMFELNPILATHYFLKANDFPLYVTRYKKIVILFILLKNGFFLFVRFSVLWKYDILSRTCLEINNSIQSAYSLYEQMFVPLRDKMHINIRKNVNFTINMLENTTWLYYQISLVVTQQKSTY